MTDKTDIGKIVAKRIKVRRAELEIRQADLAQQLGVSTGQIGHYEASTRPIMLERLSELAEVLQCSMSYLIGEDELPQRRDRDKRRESRGQDAVQ